MPPRIPDDKRAVILADIRACKTRNQIARDHDVSASTVTKLAQDNGLAFDRSLTKDATAARQADCRDLRSQLRHRLLVKANELLDQMDRPHLVFSFGGKDNTFNSKILDKPPTGDLRNLMTSAAVAIDKHAVLERLDGDGGADSAKGMIGALAAGLQAAYDQLPPDDQP